MADEHPADGSEVGRPADLSYRTCATCGADCEPDTTLTSDEAGVRIAFTCAVHGPQGVIDPFTEFR